MTSESREGKAAVKAWIKGKPELRRFSEFTTSFLDGFAAGHACGDYHEGFEEGYRAAKAESASNPNVTRVEIIATSGRAFTGRFEPGVNLSLQDEERTLKIFTGRTTDICSHIGRAGLGGACECVYREQAGRFYGI